MINLKYVVLAGALTILGSGCGKDTKPIITPPPPDTGFDIAYSPAPGTISLPSTGGTTDITITVSNFKPETNNVIFSLSPVQVETNKNSFVLDAKNPSTVVTVTALPGLESHYMEIVATGRKGTSTRNQDNKNVKFIWTFQ